MPSVREILATRASAQFNRLGTGTPLPFVQTEGGITWLTGGNVSGPAITADSALTISAMYRAQVLIASTIAAFPRHLYDELPGSPPVVSRLPQDEFLWGRPNPEVTAMEFWETVIGHEFLEGNAYMFIVRDGLDRPVELWPILPGRVRIYRDKLTRRKFYTLDGDNDVPYGDASFGGEISHVASLGRDGVRGLSLVRLMAQSLSLSKSAEEYAARNFSQGTHIAGVLETDQSLGDPEDGLAEKLSARWEKYNSGLANWHKTAVLDSGLKWKPISMNPSEMQMIDARKFQVIDVSRFTGIPAYMLDPEKTSSWGTGVAEQNQGFVTYTLTAHKVRFDQTVTDELVMTPGRRFEFDASGLLRGKLIDQVNAVYKLITAGFEPPAALLAVGLPPIEHSGRFPTAVEADPAEPPAP